MKKLFFIIAVFFSTISSGFADGVKFSASAPGQVIKGQTFQITFTLINANGQDLRVPECSFWSGSFSRVAVYQYKWKNNNSNRRILHLYVKGD